MEGPSHDTLGERGSSSPHVFRLLVSANRALVAALFLAFVPAGLLLGAFLHPAPFDFALVERAPIQGLYQALVISTVTGATLVLTLSQIVLSEEFGPVGEQRRRIEDAVSFRRDIESLISAGTPSPRPARLLIGVMDALVEHTGYLEEAIRQVDDPDATEDIRAYIRGLRAEARRTSSMLEATSLEGFGTMQAVFSFDVSAVLHETRRLRAEMEFTKAELCPTFEDIEEAIAAFASARAHIKSIYFQRELADLSRWIVYTSFPAIVVAVASLLFFDPTAIDSGWVSLTIAAVTISITLVPFAILLAYVIRIVKVTKSTFTRSPFLVRES